MTVKKKDKDSIDELFQSIEPLAESLQQLGGQAVGIYSPMVESLIMSKSTDTRQIEHLLDYMLDFCYNEKMLLLYKKLCRYYYFIDQQGAFFYVSAYREMWDCENEKKSVGIKNKKQK